MPLDPSRSYAQFPVRFTEVEAVGNLPDPNGCALGTLIFVRSPAPGALYVCTATDTPGNPHQWSAGAAGGIGVVSFSGGGAHVVPPNTDLVLLDLQGATATLTMPLLSAQNPGRSVRVVLTSNGEVTVVPAGGDTLWSGSDSLGLCCVGDSALLTPAAQWRLTDLFGALMDCIIYVDAGGDDNAQGSASNPVATILEALNRAASLGWRRYGLIYVGAGTFNQPPGASWVIPSGTGAEAWPLQIIGTEQDSGLGTLTVGGYNPGPANEAAGPQITGLALGGGDYRGYRVRMVGGTSGPAVNRQSFMVGRNDATSVTLSAASGYFSLNAGDTFVLEEPATLITWAALSARSPSITGGQLVLRSIRFDLSRPLFVQETFLLLQHTWVIGIGAPNVRGLWLWGGAEAYSGWTTIGRFGLKNSPTFNPSELDLCGLFVRMNAGGISPSPEGVYVQNNSVAYLHENTFVDATADASGNCILGFFSSFMHGNARISGDIGGGCYAYASTWVNVTPRPDNYPVLLPMGAMSVQSSAIDCANCRFEGTLGTSVLSRNGLGYVYLTDFIAGAGNDIEITRQGSLRLATNTVAPGAGVVALGGLGAPITLAAAQAGANDLAAGAASQLCYVGP